MDLGAEDVSLKEKKKRIISAYFRGPVIPSQI